MKTLLRSVRVRRGCERRYEAAKLTLASAIGRHALEVGKAWVDAVAAQQSLFHARQVNASAGRPPAGTTAYKAAPGISAT